MTNATPTTKTRRFQKGAKVYILTRSETKAKAAIETIKSVSQSPAAGADIKLIYLDLADLTTVKPAAEAFAAQEKKLDVLWNNAGIGASPSGTKTKKGFEIMMGTNALGAYLLIHVLLPKIINAAKTARANSVRFAFSGSPVIWSHAPIGGIDIKQLISPGSDMSIHYAMSKAGNWFLASKFANILGNQGI